MKNAGPQSAVNKFDVTMSGYLTKQGGSWKTWYVFAKVVMVVIVEDKTSLVEFSIFRVVVGTVW